MKEIIASLVIFKHSYSDLKLTLESLLGSDKISKVILIDNDTTDWAHLFKHEKIRYLKSPGNVGFGSGHNLSIRRYASESSFFLICNPDVIFDSNEFDKLVNFASTQQAGLFLPRIIYEDGRNQFGARLLPTPLNLFVRRFSSKYAEILDNTYLLKNLYLDKPSFVPYLHGCFMLFRSSALLKLGGFDERYFMYMEDVDLSRRCAEQFGNLYYPLAKVTHLHEQGSYKNKFLLKAHLKSAFQYFQKWGWFFDSNRQCLNKKCLDQIEQ